VINVGAVGLGQIDLLAQEGFYANRTALRGLPTLGPLPRLGAGHVNHRLPAGSTS
jgi:hypothetical protein